MCNVWLFSAKIPLNLVWNFSLQAALHVSSVLQHWSLSDICVLWGSCIYTKEWLRWLCAQANSKVYETLSLETLSLETPLDLWFVQSQGKMCELYQTGWDNCWTVFSVVGEEARAGDQESRLAWTKDISASEIKDT